MAASANTPKLTRDQVAKAFSLYGYTPDERDLTWWGTQDASTYAKLISNLKARRDSDDAKLVERAKAAAAQKNINAQNSGVSSQSNQPDPSTTVVSTIGGTKKLYPLGDYSLVKFTDSPTVFLVDFKNKQLRPFLSQEAFNTSYQNPEDANKAIITLDPSEHTRTGGALSDFQLLPYEYGISNFGQMKQMDINTNNIKNYYGQKEMTPDQAMVGIGNLSQFLGSLKNNPKSGIDSSFIDKISSDPNLGSFYANAILYGGYTFDDVYKDIKKRELADKGDTQYQNMKFIDDSMPKSQYLNTNEGQAASKNMLFQVPQEFSGVNPSLFSLSVFQLPPEAFKQLNPAIDITSPQYKADLEKIQSSFHDILLQKIGAQTEEDKAVADSNWDKFKTELEDSYNIKLSNNVMQAWNQIQQITQNARTGGISGSGIEAEGIDDYLKSVRQQNEVERKNKLSQEESKAQSYYSSFASPDQIKQLMEEDQAKGLPRDQWRVTKWGLLPSQETLDALDINTLKQKFPDVPEEQLQSYRNQIIDENGLVRSTLYGNYEKNKAQILTGQLPMEQAMTQSKQEYQQQQLINRNLEAEKKAEQEFTKQTAEDMFSQPGAGVAQTPKETAPATTTTPPTTTTTPSSTTGNIKDIYPGGTIPSKTLTGPVSTVSAQDVFNQNKAAKTTPTTPWRPKDTNKVPIPGPSQIKNFTNVEKNPNGIDMWGIPKQATPVAPKPAVTVKPTAVKTPAAPKTSIKTQYQSLSNSVPNQSQPLFSPYTPPKTPTGGDYSRTPIG